MNQPPFHGFIEVICGSMFSGKTEELLRRVKRAHIAKQKVQLFKPALDNRYSEDHVQSHDATRLPSISIQSAREILDLVEDTTRIVGVDEAQFLDDSLVEIADKLAYRGIRVIIAGLDMDYRGQPFGPMPKLLAIAEAVTKLTAVCTVCGGAATRSQRILEDAPAPQSNHQGQNPILVGALESYEARCRFHHERDAVGVPARQMGMPRARTETRPEKHPETRTEAPRPGAQV